MGKVHKVSTNKSKRGRPAAKEVERHHAKLLDAATEVFLQAGFAGAKMTLIAKKAGASMETLYSRYPTKSQLFEALIERKSSGLFDSVGPFSPDRDIREALLRFAVELLAMMMKPDNRELHRLVIAESIAFPELGLTFWRAGPGRGFAAIRNYLEQQRSSGNIMVDDVDRAAEVFLSLLVGGITLRTNLGLRSLAHSRKQQLNWAKYSVDLFLSTLR